MLVWGAINAIPPQEGAHQTKFKVDYSGGWGTYHTLYWKSFARACGRYDGPALPNVVAACKASDGSYWAAQSWPQPLPDLGFTPWLPSLRAKWLEVSHWTGDVAKLDTGSNWVYGGRFQAIFGRLTYNGAAGLRLRHDALRRADGRLRQPRLSRHLQLRLRLGLAARELVRHAQPDRRLLLRLLPLRPDQGRLQASARAGRRSAAPAPASSTA